jgi:hypothetical protein
MKKHYGKNITLLYTDTDSLIYHIKTADVYADLQQLKSHFDFANYEKTHPLFDKTNNKVYGKMKDETAGVIIEEFIALKSKMYSFITEEENIKKAKGVKKCVVEDCLSHNDYKQSVIDDSTVKMTQMNTIRHFNHELYSVTINKVGLTSYDDKSYYLDSMNALRYGHYKTKIIKYNNIHEPKSK